MKTTIVIPTYWRGPAAEAPLCTLESDYKYDHATPLDTEGTLERALDSLEILNGGHDFAVAVVAVSTREEIKQAVEIKVRNILAEFEYDFPMFMIGPDELVAWRQRLTDAGLREYDHFLSLEGYPNIRNMCLLAAILTGADVAVLFDDDELYEDPGYLDKALEFIGGSQDGSFVGGVAGYYEQPLGGYMLPPPETEWQRIWGSAESMNEAFRHIGEAPRLKKTPFVFGGNMVIHRTLFEKIPFDPAIPRGEDIDYLINCKFFGYDFFLDNLLGVRHLPPPKCAPPWFQLRQDIVRFARERAKITSQKNKSGFRLVLPGDLDPYPGRFLKDNFHDLVLATSLEMASSYMVMGREKDAHECMVNIAINKAESRAHENAWENYLTYQAQWEKFAALAPSIGFMSPPGQTD